MQAFVHDAKRFSLYNRQLIEQTPLQLYCAGLIFAPENSIVRRQFEDCIPQWIQLKPRVQKEWGASLQVLDHGDDVRVVAFSPDGRLIMSCSRRRARLWDAETGALLRTLEGENFWAISFSPLGQLVASGSNDKVLLWDITTGTCLSQLEGH